MGIYGHFSASHLLGDEASRIVLTCPTITESSGVGCAGDGWGLWTHNDSGDGPNLYAFDCHGGYLGTVRLDVDNATDWEDMCSFQVQGKPYLAVADTGDNQLARPYVEILVIEEPKLESLRSAERSPLVAPIVERYRINFSDGPCDCEALAYDPLDDSFLRATKERWRCRLFAVRRIPLSSPSANINRHTRVVSPRLAGTVLLPLVTAADISRDGRQLVLGTYGPACLIQRAKGTADSWQFQASNLTMLELPARRQGEAICFSPSGTQLYVTTEGTPAWAWRLPISR
ncbi:MAG: hypothetical protein KatS3mg111_1848 [Pirellulaceae bacterium]|nr:MAG: hypothetical protein KatS3mg111_1848 [Pirellulaceae bacterium]